MATQRPGMYRATRSTMETTTSMDSPGTLTRRLRRLNTLPDDMEDPNDSMEPNLADTSHMNFVDGRCSCCPYGYHIDVDFMRYCDSVNDGTYLRNLKKIKRNKRRLRKSMEIYLQQQESGRGITGPPPDVINSHEEHFMRAIEKEDHATNRILEDIDSSVNATLSSIDTQIIEGRRSRLRSSEYESYEYDSDASFNSPSPVGFKMFGSYSPTGGIKSPGPPVPPKPSRKQVADAQRKYRSETQLLLTKPPQPLVPTMKRDRSDSVSSFSSQSTQSSEVPYQTSWHTSSIGQTAFTSVQLAELIESHLPRQGEVNGDRSGMVSISQKSLDTIRNQLALGLHHMRELEEQIRALPVLQVRISVLKEEKRLLMLQLKAKSSKLNMRSVGVGDHTVGNIDQPYDEIDHFRYGGGQQSYSITQETSLTRSRVPEKPRLNLRSVGVGDGNVFAPEIQQTYPLQNTAALMENRQDLSTDRTVHTQEKELLTVVLGQGIQNTQNYPAKSLPAPISPKPKVRSIGVGDYKVDDVSAGMQVQEKEMRTVIIGQSTQPKQTRNVGISCRVPMRDVGISYMLDDEMPFTKNVAVGVGEIGVQWTREEDEKAVATREEGQEMQSSSSQSISTMLKQLQMTQYYTSSVEVDRNDIRLVLDQMLKKSVHSKAVMCQPERENKVTQYEGQSDTRSIGVGSDTIDVEVRPIKKMKSVSVDHRPQCFHRSVATDRAFTIDATTNTQKTQLVHRSTTTMPTSKYTVSTNTDPVRQSNMKTETDQRIFMSLDVIQNTSVNTDRVETYDAEVNTDEFPKKVEKRTHNRGVNTEILRRSIDRSVNTDKVRQINRAVGESAGSALIDKAALSPKPITKNVAISTMPILTKSIAVGDYSVRHDESTVNETQEIIHTAPVSSTVESYTVKKHRQFSDDRPDRRTQDFQYGGDGSAEQSTTTKTKSWSVRQDGGPVTKRTEWKIDSKGDVSQKPDKDEEEFTTWEVSTSQESWSPTGVTTFEEQEQRSADTLTEPTATQSAWSEQRQISSTQSKPQDSSYHVTKTVNVSRSEPSVKRTVKTTTYQTQLGSGLNRSDGGSTISGYTEREPLKQGGVRVSQESTVKRSVGYQDPQVTRDSTERTDRHIGMTGISHEADSEEVTKGVGNIVSQFERQLSPSGREITVTRVATRTRNLSTDSDDQYNIGRPEGSYTTYQVVRTQGQGHGRGDGSRIRGDAGRIRVDGITLSGDVSSQSEQGSGSFSVGRSGSGSAHSGGFTSKTVQSRSHSYSSKQQPKLDDNDNETVSVVSSSSMKMSPGGSTVGGTAHSSISSSSMKMSPGGSTVGGTAHSSISSSGMQTSSSGDSQGPRIRFEKDEHGNTQMRVIEHVETAYVGDTPVWKSSSVELLDDCDGKEPMGGFRKDSRIDSSGSEGADMMHTVTVHKASHSHGSSGQGLSSAKSGLGKFSGTMNLSDAGSEDSSMKFGRSFKVKMTGDGSEHVISESLTSEGQTVESSESQKKTNGALKSIMKHSPGPAESPKPRRGISFADDVVGGYLSASSEDEDGQGKQGEKTEAQDQQPEEEDTASEDSFDEGEYDGQAGEIIYTRKVEEEGETQTQGQAFDQNIRDTYELEEEMRTACEIYAQWLEDSTEVSTKQLNAAKEIIAQDWFRVSSPRLADVGQVEDYLSSFNEISGNLLQHIVNMPDANGNTVIHYAVSHCNMDLMSLMLDTGVCDVNRANKAGYTAIMLAALAPIQTEDQEEVVRRLFAAGDVNMQASQAGQTALMLAVSHGRLGMVNMLLDNNADVNVQDDDGSTALMCACEHGHTDIVKVLLAQPSTDASIADHDGSNALAIAMDAGHKDIAVLLYAHLNLKKQPSSPEARKKVTTMSMMM